MTRPRLKLNDGKVIELLGGPYPYLWIGEAGKLGEHLASGPAGTEKRAKASLETFLRRSLEIVTGKEVTLK